MPLLFNIQEVQAKWHRNESSDADNSRLGRQFDSTHEQHVVVEQSGIVEHCREVGHVPVAQGESDVERVNADIVFIL